jgi:hypothetical protein
MSITQEGKLRKTQFVCEIVQPSSKIAISARDEGRWTLTGRGGTSRESGERVGTESKCAL